ncbi:MAG TPA: hypothetical protein VNY05_13050 [Candidatus Acidoferrales bacterium]|jgi:hypothetical protein|nr:hypothetical protein [Candidatus Acidoferrales bacterium]
MLRNVTLRDSGNLLGLPDSSIHVEQPLGEFVNGGVRTCFAGHRRAFWLRIRRYQGKQVFRELGRRMDELPELQLGVP